LLFKVGIVPSSFTW